MTQHTNMTLLRLACVAVALTLPSAVASAETVYYLRADVTTLTVSGDVEIPMWGFALDSSFEVEDGEVTIPGPRLTVPAGDSLTIYLKNKLTAAATGFGSDVPVSIVIPGQTAAMTPVRWDAGEYAGRIRSLTHETEAGNATAVAYAWPSVKPGTYVYQSGTHMQVQVQMGLCGCLTVDAAPGEAYPGLAYDREAMLIYTEIDPYLHNAVATGNYGPGELMSSTVNYTPMYFLVNGQERRPDSPPLQTVQPFERVLLRLVNLGLKSHIPALNGHYMDVVAEDGSPYPFARQQYSVLLPANKTTDAILVPQTPGNLPILDRMLALSADEPGVGGLFAHIQVDEDVVSKWNGIAIDTLSAEGLVSTRASRLLAMVHGAMFDSINAIREVYNPLRATSVTAPADASPEAAAVEAAYQVLLQQAPQQAAMLNLARANSMYNITEDVAKTDGIAVGAAIAADYITWRAGDHSTDMVSYVPGNDPGDWRPTPPMNAPAMLPQWRYVTPFVLGDVAAFRPSAPPALDSSQYAEALEEVRTLGAKTSATRTMHQTHTAMFWADSPGTVTTVGRWNLVARQVAAQYGLSLYEKARLFALLNAAMADAGFAVWDCKYEYSFWRPITAIRDGEISPDSAWEPLLMTPAFPEYVSAHSAFSAAAAETLVEFFGADETSFSLDAYGQPMTTRAYTRFSDAANEAGISRIYGGIHYSFSNTLGLELGRQVAQFVMANAMTATAKTAR